jgi:hypothetical protein
MNGSSDRFSLMNSSEHPHCKSYLRLVLGWTDDFKNLNIAFWFSSDTIELRTPLVGAAEMARAVDTLTPAP